MAIKDTFQRILKGKYAELEAGNYTANQDIVVATLPARAVVQEVKVNIVSASTNANAATIEIGGNATTFNINASAMVELDCPFKLLDNSDLIINLPANDATINVSIVYMLPTGERDYL